MIWTWVILCLVANTIILVSCACDIASPRIICGRGDTPICLSSKWVCKRDTGVCFSDEDCRIGDCAHPICDTSHHRCYCGQLPLHRHHCTSNHDCTGVSCGSSHMKNLCHKNNCYGLGTFYVQRCGHHNHRLYTCDANSCPSPYSSMCSSGHCDCYRDSLSAAYVECLDDSDCSHHHCSGSAKPVCENSKCVCIAVHTSMPTSMHAQVHSPIGKVDGACQDGWTKFGGNCYRKYFGAHSWEDAFQHCVREHSTLVDIGSPEEQAFVHTISNGKDVWTSGLDDIEHGKWIWAGSGQTWSYSNWGRGQPNNERGDKHCAIMTASGHWDNVVCGEPHDYVCEQTTVGHECTSPWINKDGACYLHFSNSATWSDALKTCQKYSATLVNVNSPSENSYIHELSRREDIWIGGFTKRHGRYWFWVGVDFEWHYSHWDSGEPRVGNGNECVAMKSQSKWQVITCNHHLPFVCERKLSTVPVPVINGGWSNFGHYGACSKTCGGGTHTRSRTCTHPAPKNGGADCSGPSTETAPCNTSPCPVEGSWLDWGSWGNCSVSCGGGTRERLRTCSHPVPSHGGVNCTGSNKITEHCSTNACPIDGFWSVWGTWGHCSVSCGGGTRERLRTCTNPAPIHGGANCTGSHNVKERCNAIACPIDGHWSGWGHWGHCSVSCGSGTQERHRTCTNPAPNHGGANCVGLNKQTNHCNNSHCPTAAPTGVSCPDCDENLNCVVGRVCPDTQTCMIRSYPNFKFTVHCSIKDDCEFIKAIGSSGEIYCCNDQQCISNVLGI